MKFCKKLCFAAFAFCGFVVFFAVDSVLLKSSTTCSAAYWAYLAADARSSHLAVGFAEHLGSNSRAIRYSAPMQN